MPPPERSTRRPLDAQALARVRQRLNAATAPPWLHGEVARRMAERLGVIKLQPPAIADWPAHTGASRALLRQAYPAAQLLAVEPDATRRDASAAALARPWWSPERWREGAAQVLTPEQLGAGQVQLLWSNMALHLAADPQALFAAWHRALAVDGFLMFSTLGPGSLTTLRGVYAEHGWGAAFAPFVDMHDLGDMLVEAGFADPVMDQETLTLTWPDAGRALDELRGLGGNMATTPHARTAHAPLAPAAARSPVRPGGASCRRPHRAGVRDRLRSRIPPAAAAARGGGNHAALGRPSGDGAQQVGRRRPACTQGP